VTFTAAPPRVRVTRRRGGPPGELPPQVTTGRAGVVDGELTGLDVVVRVVRVWDRDGAGPAVQGSAQLGDTSEPRRPDDAIDGGGVGRDRAHVVGREHRHARAVAVGDEHSQARGVHPQRAQVAGGGVLPPQPGGVGRRGDERVGDGVVEHPADRTPVLVAGVAEPHLRAAEVDEC